MAFALQDADEMLLNRGDSSYKVSGKNFKSSFNRMYLSRYGDVMSGDLSIEASYGFQMQKYIGYEGFIATFTRYGQITASDIIDCGTF